MVRGHKKRSLFTLTKSLHLSKFISMWFRSVTVVLLLTIFLSCDQAHTGKSDLLSFIPDDSSLIVKINNLNTFRSELKNNHFLNDIKNTTSSKRISQSFRILNKIQTDTTSLIALYEKDSAHVLYVGYAKPNWLSYTDSTEFNTSFKEGIQHIDIDGLTLFAKVLEGKRIASTSKDLLNEATRISHRRNAEDPLQVLYRTVSPQKSASVFINTQQPSSLLPGIFGRGNAEPELMFSDWMTFDFNSGQQYLYLNGLAHVKDTTNNLLKLFQGTNSLPAVTPELAPADSDAILVYTFDDYERFARNQQQYLDSPYTINTPFNTVEEIGHIYRGDQRAVLIGTFASEAIETFLEGISLESSDYQGNDITNLSENNFLSEAFNPLVKDFRANYYCIIEDKYIFAESAGILEAIIANRNSAINFKSSTMYSSASENLTNQSNILLLTNIAAIGKSGSLFFSEPFIREQQAANLKNYIYSSQFAADRDFYHTHLAVNRQSSQSKSGATSPLFSIELDNDLSSYPQFVINHRTNRKEIVVQDAENNLYLISTEGKVLWKKELEGPIQGKIKQVDIYKNGRLQLAFTTDNKFIILDRNGKEVLPFSKSYPGGNLNPLAVFDYENNKDYRFVVTQGSKVFMYNSKGQVVSGFKYTEAETDILGRPKHMRIGSRDYLVFKLANGELKILSRVGSERISVGQSIEFSDNEVYLYRNKFIVTDKAGTLFSIDTDGKISKSDLNFNEDHKIDATTKTLATLNENSLTIKGRSRDLDLGVYLEPVIFYLYDKIYVTTTDIQSGQVFLFDSSNRSISGFPVYGNSVADMADMDNDGKLELVTKDSDNSLIVYSLR